MTLPAAAAWPDRVEPSGAAQRDLVPLIAVLIPRECRYGRWVVAAAVDATADVQIGSADVVQLDQILVVAGRDGVGNQQAAGIVGQRAEVAAGAGDHVGEQRPLVLARQGSLGPPSACSCPTCARAASRSGRASRRLRRRRTCPQMSQLRQSCSLCASPGAWPTRRTGSRRADRPRSGRGRCRQSSVQRQVPWRSWAIRACSSPAASARRRQGNGRGEHMWTAIELGLGHGVRAAVHFDDLAEFLFHGVDMGLAFGLDQNLDAGLGKLVVAAAQLVGRRGRWPRCNS